MREVLSEEQFFSIVKEKTGKDIYKNDYGFICGTHNPFGLNRGKAASMREGYTIWKKNSDGTISKINIKNEEDGLKATINFLNNTNFKIRLSKA